jgi:hypothetical protein
MLILLLCALTPSVRADTASYVLASESDFILAGTSVVAAPLLSLRSGGPHTIGVKAACAGAPLSPGTTVRRVTLEYRYDTGYGTTGTGANFTLRVAGQAVYASPPLTDFAYDLNRTNYSAPVAVDARRRVSTSCSITTTATCSCCCPCASTSPARAAPAFSNARQLAPCRRSHGPTRAPFAGATPFPIHL